MKPKREYKDQPRPVRYRADDSAADREFHEIRLALTMLFEDEGRPVMDQTIRAACYGAADLGDLRAAGRIIAGLGPRAKIGPVAAFKKCVVIDRLPKTRSGKILRGTMKKIADSTEYTAPATIDDPAILNEIGESLRTIGYAKT